MMRADPRLVLPCGDQLVNLLVAAEAAQELKAYAARLPMYARARRGEIKGWTGIDDPYEAPAHPEITLDTVSHSPEHNARQILEHLQAQGFVRSPEPAPE